jgi:predicted DNA-binding protein (MmcQ/YjbR family)
MKLMNQLNDNVPDNVVKELLDKSYNEILNKLTKKKRAEILSL